MAVKVNGNRGLNFTGTFDISDVEEKAKKVIDTFSLLQKQSGQALGKIAVDDSFRKEQLAIQKALSDSRLATQKLKEEQQSMRNEQEKNRAIAAEYRAESERLQASERALNLEYKQGKIAAQEYALEQRKIADAQREAVRAQKEAERTLREQTRLQKEQERQAERNRKQLERESSEYYKLTQALGKVRSEAKNTQAEMFRLEREGLKASDAYRLLEIRSKALTAQTQILDQGVKKIDASLGLHQRNVGNYGDALTNLSPLFASINQNLGNFGTSIDDLASRPDPFKALGTSLMAFGRASLAFLATPIGAIIGLLGGLYALISSNKQTVVAFDSGLQGVAKTTNTKLTNSFGCRLLEIKRKEVAMRRVDYPALIKEGDEPLRLSQKSSGKVLVYQRLQMLRLLKSGKAATLVEAAPLVGATERSLQNWWRRYREQGLEGLLQVKPTRTPRLSAQQQQTLLAETARGEFASIAQIRGWVEQRFGIGYTEVGMWKLVTRLRIRKKTPRPSHVKKDEAAVERFKKTSLPLNPVASGLRTRCASA